MPSFSQNLMRIALATGLSLASAGAGFAQTVEQALIAELKAQGYTRIERSRTFLGRVRLEAEGNGIEREIIFNPRTGEILRDFWEIDDDDNLPLLNPGDDDDPESASDGGAGSGGDDDGGSDDDDDGGSDDDEDGDDDDDDSDDKDDEDDENDERDDRDRGDVRDAIEDRFGR